MELSGGSRGGARPLILGIKEEMAEGKKASTTAGQVNRDPPPPPPLAQGLDPPLELAIYMKHSSV